MITAPPPVTTANWRGLACGTIEVAMRDSNHLALDMLLTDTEPVTKVGGGEREPSKGYSSDLEFADLTPADDAKSIPGNHVALVHSGRAGPQCVIKDGFAVCDTLPSNILSVRRALCRRLCRASPFPSEAGLRGP